MPFGIALQLGEDALPQPVSRSVHFQRVLINDIAPVDRQVDQLTEGKSPLERAEAVLLAAGIERPTDYDDWVDFIGVDFKQIPIVGSVGEGMRRTKRK